MSSFDLGGFLQPYVVSHPWMAPLLAAGTVLGWLGKVLFAIWRGVQQEKKIDQGRSSEFLEVCRDQRDVAMKDAENWRRRAEKAESELEELRNNHDRTIPFRRQEVLDNASRAGDRAG